MAHFNLEHDNSRGRSVSVGDPTHAHIRGWHSGVNVQAREQDGRDVFYVYVTSGSDTQQHVSLLVGIVDTEDNSPVWKVEDK